MQQDESRRQFWAVHPDWQSRAEEHLRDAILPVTGFDRAAYGKDAWWVPSVGYTLTYGQDVFDTEAEAAAALMVRIGHKMIYLENLSAAILARMSGR